MLRLPKPKEIKNKKVLLRIDINVENFNIHNIRFQNIQPTIKFLLKNKAKQIIIISHLGRPRHKDPKYSLKKTLPVLEKVFNHKIVFYDKLDNLPSDKIVLLENIRFWKGEENNDIDFAKKLAKLADIYINEAFSVSHRQHASVSAITKLLPSYYGFDFIREIKQINEFKKSIKKPALMILGGAKIKDKLPLIQKFNHKVNNIIIGGALANTLLDMLGFNIGRSLTDKNIIPQLRNLNFAKIILPFDFWVLDKNNTKQHRFVFEIQPSDNILDVGNYSLEYFNDFVYRSKTIFWNGPMGYIEDKQFQQGTVGLVNLLKVSKAKILVGGGETLNFTKPIEHKQNVFVSTGGGALLAELIK